MSHFDDLLAGVGVTLTNDIPDRIDEIVPPGTAVGTLDMAYLSPALQRSSRRRRPVDERAAT
jgi:aryl-alcohol dehydrogenase (NADP+)